MWDLRAGTDDLDMTTRSVRMVLASQPHHGLKSVAPCVRNRCENEGAKHQRLPKLAFISGPACPVPDSADKNSAVATAFSLQHEIATLVLNCRLKPHAVREAVRVETP